MDIPVTTAFVQSANPAQLHSEARGAEANWPASFVKVPDGSWVYRIDDPGSRTEQDVSAAVAAHIPDPEWRPPGAENTWRIKLSAEISAIEAALADAGTNWPSATVIKRLARNQVRILRWIRDREMDSGNG